MKLPARALAQETPEVESPLVEPPPVIGPSRRRLSGLQRRFLAIVLAGAAGFAVIAGAAVYLVGHARSVEVGREEIRALLNAVGKTAAIGAYAGDRVLIQEILHGIADHPLIARAEVTNFSGELLGEAGTPGGNADASMLVNYPLASPFDAYEQVGILRATIERSRLEADARRVASLLASVMAGQTALVAMLLYLAASLLVSRPIARLARMLRQMKPGNFEPLATPERHRHDEIGTLIASANTLLAGNAEALNRERALRAAIEEMEAQYRQIFDASSAGIFVLDGDGRLINGNPTVMRMIGRPVEEIRSLRRDAFIETVFARPERVRELIDDAARRRETVSADLEVLHSDRLPRWAHCLISVQGPQAQRRLIEGVMYDVTERMRQEAEVRHRAEHDALTGLINRASVESALDSLIDAASIEHTLISVLYLDLDGFKRVNDGLGHEAGDRILVEVARRLRQATSSGPALVARVGGDEFILVLPGLGPDAPLLGLVAERIIRDLQHPIPIAEGSEARIGASLGIACFPRHGTDRRHLVHAADAVMYEVKRNGRNSFAMAPGEPAAS